jgi:hypothetical protein
MEKENNSLMTICKKGVTLTKLRRDLFQIENDIENSNIILGPIFTFDFIHIFNQINPDIYKVIEFNSIDDNTIQMILLLEHFFKDFGLPQHYLNLKIIKTTKLDSILFTISTFSLDQPSSIPSEIKVFNVQLMTISLHLLHHHKVHSNINIKFDDSQEVPIFMDKLVGNILCKVFIRLKQFIEKIKL